jgi:hypothetical protein
MQTVEQSSPKPVMPSDPVARKPDLRAMRQVSVTPVVPRRNSIPTRESLQAAEDGGEAEAHPS